MCLQVCARAAHTRLLHLRACQSIDLSRTNPKHDHMVLRCRHLLAPPAAPHALPVRMQMATS